MLSPVASLLALVPTLCAQSNVVPGLDVSLGELGPFAALDRIGTFPGGVSGCSMETTACNKGSVEPDWKDGDSTIPMNDLHPWISFLTARESGGRIEQISDRSYMKAGFGVFAQSVCDTCSGCGVFGFCDYLPLGCSDTYTVGLNGNNYYLLPPEELDPWLGTWDPFCTYFDRGDPPVGSPADCDGVRSFTSSMSLALLPVGNRMRILDSDLNVAGANYYYCAGYVLKGEPEADRWNNIGSQEFAAVWAGDRWTFNGVGPLLHGTVLQRWAGAGVSSATNAGDDGRVFVAVKVTGPTGGLYHYEYAVHNRDNFRGVDSLRIPICPEARILNAGFRDVDQDASNDWTLSIAGGVAEFSTAANSLRWNSLYNFWFDSDAAPVAGSSLELGAADPGPGAGALQVTSDAPLELYNSYLGDGCSIGGGFPTLYATGSPAQATLGNTTFGLASTGNAPTAPHVLVASSLDGSLSLGSCTQWFAGTLGAGAVTLGVVTSDGAGVANHTAPIPNDPSFEGLHINVQAAGLNPAGGPVAGLFELTSALRIRIGDALSPCP